MRIHERAHHCETGSTRTSRTVAGFLSFFKSAEWNGRDSSSQTERIRYGSVRLVSCVSPNDLFGGDSFSVLPVQVNPSPPPQFGWVLMAEFHSSPVFAQLMTNNNHFGRKHIPEGRVCCIDEHSCCRGKD